MITETSSSSSLSTVSKFDNMDNDSLLLTKMVYTLSVPKESFKVPTTNTAAHDSDNAKYNYNYNNNNDNDNNNKCDRRLSRAARYILFRNLQEAFLLSYGSGRSTNMGHDDSNDNYDFTNLTNLFPLYFTTQSYWDIVHRVLVLPTSITTATTSSSSTNATLLSSQTQDSDSFQFCSKLFWNDMYKDDELNSTIMAIADDTNLKRYATLHHAIPGIYTPPPKRNEYKYRKASLQQHSNSIYYNFNRRNQRKMDLSVLDRIMLLEKQYLSSKTDHKNNNNNINQQQTRWWLSWLRLLPFRNNDPDRSFLLLIKQQHLLKHDYNAWHRHIRTNQTFINRYYLDAHLDRYHASKNENDSHINDTGNSSTQTMCPATDWCGTFISEQECYDTALLLEPYYGDTNNKNYNNDKRTTTLSTNTNTINKNPYKQQERFYKKQSDWLSSQCTMTRMKQIEQTCRTIVQTCTAPLTTTTDDATSMNLARFHNALLQSLCSVRTCHGRLYRIIDENIGTGHNIADHMVVAHYHRMKVLNNHNNIHNNNNRSIMNDNDSYELGLTSVLALLVIGTYYGYRWWYSTRTNHEFRNDSELLWLHSNQPRNKKQTSKTNKKDCIGTIGGSAGVVAPSSKKKRNRLPPPPPIMMITVPEENGYSTSNSYGFTNGIALNTTTNCRSSSSGGGSSRRRRIRQTDLFSSLDDVDDDIWNNYSYCQKYK